MYIARSMPLQPQSFECKLRGHTDPQWLPADHSRPFQIEAATAVRRMRQGLASSKEFRAEGRQSVSGRTR